MILAAIIQKYTTGISEYRPRNGSVIIKIPTGKNICMYLLSVMKGKNTAQASIGVKFAGNPIKRAAIRQRSKSQHDFKVSII